MTAGIITILAALIPALVGWWVNRNAVANSPAGQQKARYATAEKDIIQRNALAASQHGLDDLAELERLQSAQGNPK